MACAVSILLSSGTPGLLLQRALQPPQLSASQICLEVQLAVLQGSTKHSTGWEPSLHLCMGAETIALGGPSALEMLRPLSAGSGLHTAVQAPEQ